MQLDEALAARNRVIEQMTAASGAGEPAPDDRNAKVRWMASHATPIKIMHGGSVPTLHTPNPTPGSPHARGLYPENLADR